MPSYSKIPTITIAPFMAWAIMNGFIDHFSKPFMPDRPMQSGTRFLIHSAQTHSLSTALTFTENTGIPIPKNIPTSSIIGSATFQNAINKNHITPPNNINADLCRTWIYLTIKPRQFDKPIPLKGQFGWFYTSIGLLRKHKVVS